MGGARRMFEARHAWEQIYRQEGLTLDDPFLRFPELVEEFREHKCERILDLGCGSGRHVLALARNGFEVVGLDAAPTGISLAKAWIAEQGDHAQLVLGDLSYPLPFRSESFDGLMATQVIHHALQEHIPQDHRGNLPCAEAGRNSLYHGPRQARCGYDL